MPQKKDDMRTSTIYGIRCKSNGKIYIGATVDLEQRVKTHFAELKFSRKVTNGSHKGLKLWQEDFDRYGIDDFEVYVIESDVPKCDRRKRENYYIEMYKSYIEEYGYNSHTEREYHFNVPMINGLPPLKEVKL